MPKVALLFPGQGAQFVGMAREYADGHPRVGELFERAAEVIGLDLWRLCDEGPAEELNSTAVSQPAIFVTSLAALEVFRERHGADARSVGAAAGLSLGEYTALVYAGALSFEDGLRLVYARGRWMQQASEACAGGMVSILGLDESAVATLCQELSGLGVIRVANLNCPRQVVVSGTEAACRAIGEEAERRGAIRAVRLKVAGAFHSPLMQPAAEPLEAMLAGIPMRAPQIPVVANVTGDYHPADVTAIRRNLVRQVTHPVLWERGVRRLLADGFDRFYEVGPGKVLTGLMRWIDRDVVCEKV